MKKIYVSFLLMLAFLLSVNLINGQTVVTSDADGGDGTLRQALIDAKDGVADITFSGNMVIELDSVMDLDTLRIESITIDGGDNDIIVDGKGTTRLIRAFIPENKMTIKNVTFQNAGELRGAAMHLRGINRFENCTFKDSYSSNHGGAIFVMDTIEFINCKFINNESNIRGGAVAGENAKMTYVGCLFDGNTVLSKGGPAIGAAFNTLSATSTTMVVNCTFVNNSVGGATTSHPRRGGTIHYGNWGAEGSWNEPLVVVNSVFWNNPAPNEGVPSAIMLDNDATLEVYNSLMQGASISMDTLLNDSVDFPAIKFFGNANVDSSILSIENCIDGRWTGPYGNGTDDFTYTPFTNFSSGNYTLALELGAAKNPAVNGGISTGYDVLLPDSDLIGEDRISGTEIDLGAYEYVNIPPTLVRPVGSFTIKLDAADTIIDVSVVFTDPDDDDMSYALVSNSDDAVATASMAANELTISAVAVGTTDVEYAVTSGGVTVTDAFTVTVEEANAVKNSLTERFRFRVYPNPMDEQVTVDFANIENASITVSDISGRTVLSKEHIQSGDVLSTSDLNQGIYIINLRENNSIITSEIVVKR